jgi:hypothetical protein
MSDDYLKVIPVEPTHIPPAHLHPRAVDYLERLFPKGDEVEVQVYEAVTFIDQGSNLEAIICPSCGTRISLGVEDDPVVSWWHDLGDHLAEMPADSVSTTIPCCGATVKATDLLFDWPAGFARFEISVLNPNVSADVSAAQMADLESILDCRLRKVWAHY